MSIFFFLSEHLMHIFTHHDQITLFSISVTSEGGLIAEQIDLIEEILHM